VSSMKSTSAARFWSMKGLRAAHITSWEMPIASLLVRYVRDRDLIMKVS
jgi:hypothetical protein